MMTQTMHGRFSQLFHRFNSDGGLCNIVFEQLTLGYEEPHRHFHTLTHLEQMFQHYDQIGLLPDSIYWATWYHDIVYIPGAPDNEQRSAQTARACLEKIGIRNGEIAQIEALICSTEHHRDPPVRQGWFLLDADLSVLGYAWPAYKQYLQQIRKEYHHIPQDRFDCARREFARELLSRSPLFHTRFFRDRFEAQARGNLMREVNDSALYSSIDSRIGHA